MKKKKSKKRSHFLYLFFKNRKIDKNNIFKLEFIINNN